jgi:hypothetical protein
LAPEARKNDRLYENERAFNKNVRRIAKNAASRQRIEAEKTSMARKFNVGDHVTWNSEAGRVSGMIIKVHTKNIAYKGYTHHASKEEPQYEIKSDKTDHIALHKGSALKKART